MISGQFWDMDFSKECKKLILDKFNYTCVNCNEKFQKDDLLRLHRIDKFIKNLDEVDNLVIICKKCQRLFSSYYDNPKKRESLSQKINLKFLVLHDERFLIKTKTNKLKIPNFEGNHKFDIKNGSLRSIIILDTNILLPKIFADMIVNDKSITGKSNKVKEIIDKLTNEKNMLVFTPTVIDEVVKLWTSKSDSFMYQKTFYKVKHKELKNKIKKRIEHLFSKYSSTRYFPELIITEKNIKEIKSFYELFKTELESITKQKIENLPEEIKERKISYRIEGYMPEQSDFKLLAECMYIRQNLPDGFNRVILFSEDKDFTNFKNEIERFLFVNVCSTKDFIDFKEV